jgi:hypothetical protein
MNLRRLTLIDIDNLPLSPLWGMLADRISRSAFIIRPFLAIYWWRQARFAVGRHALPQQAS